MKRMPLLLLAVASFVSISVFQNCSNNYKIDTVGDSGQNNSTGTPGNPDDPGPTPPDDPPGDPTPPDEIPTFSCQHIVLLPLSNPLIVPARDASTGICYAVQIFQAIPNGKSNLTTTIDNDVISRNHDSGPATHHPYLMGQATAVVKFEGLRNIKLSGSPSNADASIKIDNFALIGFKAVSNASASLSELSASDYAAFGTSDSIISGTNGVKLYDEVVPLTPFGPSGTATVSALDISQAISVNQNYLLDVRAEDCGGSRELSDVYIVFQ